MTKIDGTLESRRRRGGETTVPDETAATTIGGTFRRVRRGRSVRMREAPPPPDPGTPEVRAPEPAPRPARVAIMLALAHKLQRMLDERQVGSMADIADMLGVTRARVTQILDLTHLAPDVQEEILSGTPARGRSLRSERDARPLMREPDWRAQRALLR
jgi:hypothetical protein